MSNVLKNNFRQLPSFQCALVPRKSRMFTLLRKLIVTFRHKPSLNFPPNSSGLLDNPHSSFLSSLIFQNCSSLSSSSIAHSIKFYFFSSLPRYLLPKKYLPTLPFLPFIHYLILEIVNLTLGPLLPTSLLLLYMLNTNFCCSFYKTH